MIFSIPKEKKYISKKYKYVIGLRKYLLFEQIVVFVHFNAVQYIHGALKSAANPLTGQFLSQILDQITQFDLYKVTLLLERVLYVLFLLHIFIVLEKNLAQK